MNAVIYARVSTDEQAEHGHGLDIQLKACREYAAQHNLSVANEYLDDYTGATIDRPGFMQLLDGLSKGEGQAVIVYSSDRLSRNYVDGIVIRDQWHRSGIELHYVAHGKSEDSFAGDLVDVVYALTAREEYRVIRSRTMNGRLEKAKSGKPVMSGYPPFGYRREGKGPDARYIKHEPELEVVLRIFRMYVYGENGSGPMALRGIAIQLQDEGIPSNRNRKILPSGRKEQLLILA